MSLSQDPFEGIGVKVISEGRTLDLFDDHDEPEALNNGESAEPYNQNYYVQGKWIDPQMYLLDSPKSPKLSLVQSLPSKLLLALRSSFMIWPQMIMCW